MRRGDAAVVDMDGLDLLIGMLAGLGYDTRGPVVRDGAVLPGRLSSVADLPVGCHDEQAPGRYRLVRGDDDTAFGWAVGPGSWKAELFPPSQELWRATVDHGTVILSGDEQGQDGRAASPRPLALVGVRPCELAGLAVLDRVLMDGAVADPFYRRRRQGAFVVAAECGAPAGTCFCTSMGTGPAVAPDDDIADVVLTELDDDDGHRFLLRAATDRGAGVLSRIPTAPASAADVEAREQVLTGAEAGMGRRLETDDLPELLVRNLDNPRWQEVAERCLACGNCTLVCPTCFCSDVRDTSELDGTVHRRRTWSSCFDLDHSYLHGGAVRRSTSSRYRQWLTHKLATWWDQFGTSGCVGCGRCIAWCPVGIDLTEEAAAIRRSDGATTAGATGRRAR
jgi:ferredoxin